jgi:hypothetical protein
VRFVRAHGEHPLRRRHAHPNDHALAGQGCAGTGEQRSRGVARHLRHRAGSGRSDAAGAAARSQLRLPRNEYRTRNHELCTTFTPP